MVGFRGCNQVRFLVSLLVLADCQCAALAAEGVPTQPISGQVPKQVIAPVSEKTAGSEIVAQSADSAAAIGAGEPTTAAVLTATTPTVCPSLIVIDNDDEQAAEQIEETFKWQELPDSPGKKVMSMGARFPVKVVSEISSKTAKAGDPVEGQVRVDVKIGGKMIAPKGTRVVGHVFNVMPARRLLVAEVSRHRWWRASRFPVTTSPRTSRTPR